MPIVWIFVAMYVALTTAKWTRWHHFAIATSFVSLIWIVRAVLSPETVAEDFEHHFVDSMYIALFIGFAMKEVKFLDFHGLFDFIRYLVGKFGRNPKRRFRIVIAVTAVTSSCLDNVTTSIILGTLSASFFIIIKVMELDIINTRRHNFCVYGAGIIIAANVGGVASVIGDVTTFMIWEDGKITPMEVFYMVLPAAVVGLLVAVWMLERQLLEDPTPVPDIPKHKFERINYVIIGLGILSFATAIYMQMSTPMPAFLGLMLGVGITASVHELHREWFGAEKWVNEVGQTLGNESNGVIEEDSDSETKLEKDIENALREVDWVLFFVLFCLLLGVGGLETTGKLEDLSEFAYGHNPSESRIIVVSYGVGVLSSMVDNVPIAKILLDIMPSSDPWMWAFHIWSLGVGGSMLLYGSLPGFILMGIIGYKVFTFGRYLKIGALPAFACFTTGFVVILLEFLLVKVIT